MTDELARLLPELAVALYESTPHHHGGGRPATAEPLTGRQMEAVVFLSHHRRVTMGEFADGLEISPRRRQRAGRAAHREGRRAPGDGPGRPARRLRPPRRRGGAATPTRCTTSGAAHLDAVFARFPDIDPDTLVAFLGALIDQLKGRIDDMTTTTPATPAEARPAGAARNPWAVLAVLCLGLFMILLDGTIVNIAIPHIQSYYDTTYSNIEWVMNAYILAFAVLLVPLGRFGDLWGRRKLFLAGMVLFTLGSLACGLAPSIYLLIAFRVIQGIGGAAMMPSTLSIIATVFAPERRGAAMGVWGGVSGAGLRPRPRPRRHHHPVRHLAGVADSWRWIFLVNIPVGIIGVLLTLRLVPESKNPTAVKSLDLPGVGLLTASLFCLTFALIEGQNYGWTSATILGLFAGAVVAFLLFYWREHRVSQPLIDFSLFRSLNFAAGNATGLLLSAAMMGAFFTIPIFLQSVLGFSAIKAGLVMAPMSVVIIFAAPVAGMLSDRLGSKWIVAAGMFLLAVGLAWMAGLIPGVEKIDPPTTSRQPPRAVPHLRHRHRLRRRPGDLSGHGDGAQGPRRQRLRRALHDAPGRQPDGHRDPRGRAAEPGHGQHHRGRPGDQPDPRGAQAEDHRRRRERFHADGRPERRRRACRPRRRR